MGRDALGKNTDWFKHLEEAGVLRNELSSLGWAFWPKDFNGELMGFFDPDCLRGLADEIERRNKPFWDEYNAHCLREMEEGKHDENFVEEIVFPLDKETKA